MNEHLFAAEKHKKPHAYSSPSTLTQSSLSQENPAHLLPAKRPLLFERIKPNTPAMIKSRIQTKTSSNQSVHWTHQYATKGRVTGDPLLNDHSPQAYLTDLPIPLLLPAKAVQTFKVDCSMLVSRIVSKNLQPFREFKDGFINHVPHMFSKEMGKIWKSKRIALILNINTTTTSFPHPS